MKSKSFLFFTILFYVALIVGEVRCIVKLFSCDFQPSYKAEIIYGVGTITGLGAVIGYCDFGK